MLRSKFSGKIDQVMTEVDVLFCTDAVDPRPEWALIRSSLQLNAQSKVPVARLSVLQGRAKPRPEYAMDRVDELMLVESGAVADPSGEEDEVRSCIVS